VEKKLFRRSDERLGLIAFFWYPG